MNRQIFSSCFTIGEEINSGGSPERANAARLRILDIEDQGLRYQSIKSKDSKFLKYSTLDVVLDGFDLSTLTQGWQKMYLPKTTNTALQKSSGGGKRH